MRASVSNIICKFAPTVFNRFPMATNLLHSITRSLLKPFWDHFLFLVFFFIFTAGTDIFRQIGLHNYTNTLYMAASGFCLAYAVTLLVSWIKPQKLKTILQSLLLLITGISFIINFYCIFYLDDTFDKDYALLLLETNPNEIKEFMTTMLPWWMVIILGALFLILAFAWRASRRRNMNLGPKGSLIALVLVPLCLLVAVNKWSICKYGTTHRFKEFVKAYDSPYNLKQYYSHPSITGLDQNEMPGDVVLIIGESFARFHSSLYGYDKLTNPKLGALRDSSLLFTYDSIDAAAASTSLAFRYMMSTYSHADAASTAKHWYEYPSIIEMMQQCGYGCYWFSTQARGGLINGSARVFAKACDQTWFLQRPGSNLGNNLTLDELLVEASAPFVDTLSSTNHHFVVYHMMGSHFDYSMRYPQQYARYTARDYPNHLESQRDILASYDNSILYNDEIVYELIELYRDRDAVVIYMPDHGQDMFRSAPDYYMHGRENDPVSYKCGVEIPFMIYMTPAFMQRHPATAQSIIDGHGNGNPWNSEDLPYTILDLIGARGINGQDVQAHSVLTTRH